MLFKLRCNLEARKEPYLSTGPMAGHGKEPPTLHVTCGGAG